MRGKQRFTAWTRTAAAMCAVVWFASYAIGAEPAAPPPQESSFAKWERLWDEIQAHWKKGEFTNAIAAAEEVRALDGKLFGADSASLIIASRFLAACHERLEQWAQARQYREDVLARTERHYGAAN